MNMKLFVASATVALVLPLMAFAASPFEGSWKSTTDASSPTITYKMDGNVLTRSDSAGTTYELKVGGTFNAVQDTANAAGGMDALSVRMKNAHTMVEVSKRGGKVIGTLTSTVSKDGKTMTLVYVEHGTHKTTTYHANKV
jgi:hypothetical protein